MFFLTVTSQDDTMSKIADLKKNILSLANYNVIFFPGNPQLLTEIITGFKNVYFVVYSNKRLRDATFTNQIHDRRSCHSFNDRFNNFVSKGLSFFHNNNRNLAFNLSVQETQMAKPLTLQSHLSAIIYNSAEFSYTYAKQHTTSSNTLPGP